MKEKFIEFLKERGVYDKFVEYLVKYPFELTNNDHESLEAFMDSFDPELWVSASFSWSAVVEHEHESDTFGWELQKEWAMELSNE